MSYLKKAFGYNLRLLRKSKNLTQEKLAEMVNLNQRQLTRIENGLSFVSSDVLEKLVIALDIDIKELFDFNLDINLLKKTRANEDLCYQNYNEDNVIQNFNNIERILNKIKKIADSENKINYINLAIDSLSDKKALDELKMLIKGIELTLNDK